MKIVVSDITGRTLNYDYALCDAISESLRLDDRIEFWGAEREHSPKLKVRSFGSIVPSRYKTSTNTVVRLIKAFDTIIAYFKILFLVIGLKPDIFHLQWFPFLSLGKRGAGVDILFIKMMKICAPKMKMVFTIHNMCPHGMSEQDRAGYNPIFSKALQLFNHFVVHTEKTKGEVIESFGLKEDSISLVYHGVFKPKAVTFERKEWDESCVKLIMYGNQNWYKGTDVFVESLSLLPSEIKNRIKVTICGNIDPETNAKCKAINTGCEINWMLYYLDDETLYKKIMESDIILLPYRRISQSGVLLLAIATKRLIITSDLPSFKETLKGYNDNLFFQSENAQDLSDVISKYVNGNVNREDILNTLESLEYLYSWEKSAKNTISIYCNLMG